MANYVNRTALFFLFRRSVWLPEKSNINSVLCEKFVYIAFVALLLLTSGFFHFPSNPFSLVISFFRLFLFSRLLTFACPHCYSSPQFPRNPHDDSSQEASRLHPRSLSVPFKLSGIRVNTPYAKQ